MRKYVSAYVICPFYRFEDGEYHQVTVCEGLDNTSTIHLTFASRRAMEAHKGLYCCRDYRECKIAQMLFGKYDNEKE